VTAFYHGGS